MLTIDALRKDALGCYGNESGLTPFIDSLQDRCLRFIKGQAGAVALLAIDETQRMVDEMFRAGAEYGYQEDFK